MMSLRKDKLIATTLVGSTREIPIQKVAHLLVCAGALMY